jgi:membrane protein implicated in regulation of membrane protease activity
MQDLGKVFLILAGVFFIVGLLLTVGGRIPFLGRLPGDIRIQRGDFVFYFPLATSIVLSLLLTLLLNLLARFLRR